MAVTPDIKIGLETDILGAAMTGVGNYCFHLVKALMESEPKLDFTGFNGLRWQPLILDHLRKIESDHGKRGDEKTAVKPAHGRNLKIAMRSKLARIELARSVYHRFKAFQFDAAGRGKSINLFHAFRYLPLKAMDIPVLPVVYDLSFIRFPETHPISRLRELERLPEQISRALIVQTISQFSKGEIIDVFGCPAEKIIVAPPAASTIFRPAGEQVTRSNISRFELVPGNYLLAVGTLEPRKNLKTLISAYGQLSPQERARMPLAIVGKKGWGELQLPRETSAMIADGTLRFTGSVTDIQLRGLYEGARALLYPSIYEGFGMPVVEALACGTQVAHSEDTSMDEITEGSALRAAATDVDAWTTIIRQLIDGITDGAREDRIARARRFDWGVSASIVMPAYRILAAS